MEARELGGERAVIEEQIRKLSNELKVRIIGPNCIGMFNGENRLDCAFQGHKRMVRPKKAMLLSCPRVELWVLHSWKPQTHLV